MIPISYQVYFNDQPGLVYLVTDITNLDEGDKKKSPVANIYYEHVKTWILTPKEQEGKFTKL